ncbi:MAG: hypothetical protein V4455_06265, partial [Pseudomonadota bacterium]
AGAGGACDQDMHDLYGQSIGMADKIRGKAERLFVAVFCISLGHYVVASRQRRVVIGAYKCLVRPVQ